MTGATSAFDAGTTALLPAVTVAEPTLVANARRSSSSLASASGRPSASFALRARSPALPGSLSMAAWALARIRSASELMGRPYHSGGVPKLKKPAGECRLLDERGSGSVDDAEALAAGRN